MKKILAFLLIESMLLFLTGCSSANSEEKTLTLACWIKDRTVETLVSEFNESHSKCKIEIISYYDYENPDTDIDTAALRMNADIITRNTPDLFYFDSMDIMAMKNAGILADLSIYIKDDPLFTQEHIYMNVINLFKDGDALYELVPCFQLGCIYGGRSILGEMTGWTIDEYRLMQSDYESRLLGISRDVMLAYMIQFAFDSYLDKSSGRCSFDTDSFRTFLSFISEFPDVPQSSLLDAVWLSGIGDYVNQREELTEAPVYVGFPSDYAGGPCAMALGSFGMSAKTEYPWACWEFLRSLMSEENQKNIFISEGFPVLKKVFKDELNKACIDPQEENSLFFGWQRADGTEYIPLSKDDADYLENLLEGISCVRFRYQGVLDIITEEAQAYFYGTKTIDETIELIQNRVQIYISEKS